MHPRYAAHQAMSCSYACKYNKRSSAQIIPIATGQMTPRPMEPVTRGRGSGWQLTQAQFTPIVGRLPNLHSNGEHCARARDYSVISCDAVVIPTARSVPPTGIRQCTDRRVGGSSRAI
eukprot:scaffold172633_cov33-Tisochrysis_lutea.AAC.2